MNLNQKIMRQIYSIILNQSNVLSGQNNVYRYQFPQGGAKFKKGSHLAIANINMYYSWFNISTEYNNNSFQVIFPTSTTPTTLNITIPDGFYSISDLNSYLQQEFITAGLYLVNSDGDYVYYLELIENPNSYAIQLNSYPVPTSLPSGYTNPASMTFPASLTTPQLVISTSGGNDFYKLIGFSAGTYPDPAQSTTYSAISDITPQISPVSSAVVLCSLLNNRLAIPNTVCASFAPNVSFGSTISYNPNEYAFQPIGEGSYTSFDISFTDQLFNPLPIRDTDLIIQVLIAIDED